MKSVKEQNDARMKEIVRDYTRKRNWPALARLIGGNPREDLGDHTPGLDDGEPRAGAPNFV